jgi:hypothetical protein
MIPGSANSLLLASAADDGYAIERSLRFNSADSAYLSRTPASAGNRKTWTWAGWVKRSGLGSTQHFLGANNNGFVAGFGSGNELLLYDFSGSFNINLNTSQVFRDPSAWAHFVFTIDTTQATNSNRVKIYVNGVQVSVFSTATYPSQNFDTGWNAATEHRIGHGFVSSNYFNGYLADIHFIDGQALDPTSFGEFDATTGVWVPKAYTGSYGTNGFQLKFEDNSSNTATTLGKDTSGNGNNWTPNNLSITAGAGNDSLVDVPTNGAQTDTGAGGEVRGNYATWNPLITSTNLTNGNLSVVQPSTTGASRYATIGMSSGKWYWEISVVKYANTVFGIRTPGGGTLETPFDASGYGMGWRSSGGFFIGGSNTGTGSMSLAAGDVLGLAFDAGAGTLAFYKNGTLNNTLTASSTFIGQAWFAGSQDSGGGNSDHDVNFGQRAFAYTAPSGFKALNTANLPAPLVTKPSDVMDVALYTGNNTARSITGLGFSPDFVWIKGRSGSTDHALYDIVRGVEKDLVSNSTAAETTQTTGLTAFNSNGFSIGTLAKLNTNAATYAAWTWDAGSSTVTNTQGSISSQVRANASAGFSIVTYTGSSNNSDTVGHGLNITPSLVIIKNRSSSKQWAVRHVSLSSTTNLYLSSTSAAATISSTSFGGVGATTSTTFAFAAGDTDASNVNASGSNFVAYCFAPVAGYSSFGSYTGNGSADGPFVYTGFRPAFVLVKMSSSTGNWTILDSKRLGYNVDNRPLFPNLSNAEGTTVLSDITSNGFKVRTTDATFNTNAGTYVFAAWAESPFQYSRAR